ncbi:hypothetical protein [Serratia fonticola]
MEFEVLRHLERDGEHHVQQIVSKTKYDYIYTLGVIRQIIGDGGIEKLTSKQSFHYENFIKPLIENVTCEGVVGPGTCTGDGFVDDESLYISYLEDDFKCQFCRHDANNL